MDLIKKQERIGYMIKQSLYYIDYPTLQMMVCAFPFMKSAGVCDECYDKIMYSLKLTNDYRIHVVVLNLSKGEVKPHDSDDYEEVMSIRNQLQRYLFDNDVCIHRELIMQKTEIIKKLEVDIDMFYEIWKVFSPKKSREYFDLDFDKYLIKYPRSAAFQYMIDLLHHDISNYFPGFWGTVFQDSSAFKQSQLHFNNFLLINHKKLKNRKTAHEWLFICCQINCGFGDDDDIISKCLKLTKKFQVIPRH